MSMSVREGLGAVFMRGFVHGLMHGVVPHVPMIHGHVLRLCRLFMGGMGMHKHARAQLPDQQER